MKKTVLLLVLFGQIFSGCTFVNTTNPPIVLESDNKQLTEIINLRDAKQRERDPFRHPQQTLEFFEVKPNMTVVEVLPGGGWYSRILAPYLADSGVLHGLNYADAMWPMFGFFNAETIENRLQAMNEFATQVTEWGGNGTHSQGFAFERIPDEINGTVDRVLIIRALHNLNRFEYEAATRSSALNEIFKLLKPGGRVGVVQHRAPESSSDEWAMGHAGYLKQSAVISMFTSQGFEFQASSEINANPNDKPTANDIVWRLAPSLRTSKNDAAKRENLAAIGESDRMTLVFVKPIN